jgi:predicted nucleic acid-binding protein
MRRRPAPGDKDPISRNPRVFASKLVRNAGLIHATNPDDTVVSRWLLAELPSISAITGVEALGFHRFKPGERGLLENLVSVLQVIYPTPETFAIAIRLRQMWRLSVADSLIAATALEHKRTLATHNTADFDWIRGLSLTDPV